MKIRISFGIYSFMIERVMCENSHDSDFMITVTEMLIRG